MSARDTLKLDLAVDAAFDKINGKLSTIFQNDVNRKQYARSWIWELIQNARDNRREGKNVKIKVTFDESQNVLSFCHDGDYFNSESLIRLITQISSKIENNDNIGRFGSGFISTHLLSKKIKLQGAYKKENGNLVKLDFELDRSAWIANGDPIEYVCGLKEQIKDGLQRVDVLEDLDEPLTTNGQTCFIYPLENDDGLDYARIGIEDLGKQLPLVLAFNPEIDSIEINGDIYESVSIVPDIEKKSTCRSLYSITKNKILFREILVITQKTSNFQLAFFMDGMCFRNFHTKTSRLFCRFPLIGTEEFSLPFILNSELFEVTDARNALREEHPKNQKILEAALKLYNVALDYFIKNDYQGFQHICQMGNSSFKLTERNEQISKYVMEIYSSKNIVKTYRGNVQTLKNIRIPVIYDNEYPETMSNFDRKKFLKDFYELIAVCPNMEMPVFNECADWAPVFQQSHITIENLSDMFTENLTGDRGGILHILYKVQIDYIAWLNKYIKLLVVLEKNQLLKNKEIYLNQNGQIIKSTCGFIDNIQEVKLKEIYNKFFHYDGKTSIENELFLQNLDLGSEVFSRFMKSKNNEVIATEITNRARDLLASPKGENGEREQHIQAAFNEIFYWMNANEASGKSLFPAIYNDRMSFCSADEQLEHYQFSVHTRQELEKHQAKSIEDLVRKLCTDISSYSDVELSKVNEETAKIFNDNASQDDIVRLLELNAIENEDMLRRLLIASRRSAEDVAKFLEYRKTTLENAYLIVQKMLEEAAILIKHHLEKKSQVYDLREMNKIAPTVYDGVKKNGTEIRIIARPKNSNKVILYYDSEYNYLRKDCELWVVDTTKQDPPELLTFGDIVRITGIRVIPLWDLYN